MGTLSGATAGGCGLEGSRSACSGVTGWGSLPQADAPQEGGVIAHADGGVLVHHPDGDLLAGTQLTHPRRVAGVELALARLDAPRAAQERRLVHHHLVARDVSEVKVVNFYLTIDEVGAINQHLQLS